MLATSRRITIVAWVLALALFCPAARAAAGVGQPAPPLVAPEIDGPVFDLGAQRGKVVIVNFWATWCGPCRMEMPVLDTFYRRYHDRGLEMIGISADRLRDRDAVIRAIKSFSYPAAMMKDATNGFGAPEALPVTYVIGADGTVRAKFSPADTGVTEKELDDAVLPLLRVEHAGG